MLIPAAPIDVPGKVPPVRNRQHGAEVVPQKPRDPAQHHLRRHRLEVLWESRQINGGSPLDDRGALGGVRRDCAQFVAPGAPGGVDQGGLASQMRCVPDRIWPRRASSAA